jgi:hypothetical protein
MNGSKFSAADAALGYLYQVRCALLLQKTFQGAGSTSG